jgi:chemotaxis protein MotB
MARADAENTALKREARIVIVKKVKGAGHGHHGGAWKVAYADFITAMMALFIVLWITGQSKEVREYVSEYFRDPGAFNSKTNASIITANVQTLAKDVTGLKNSIQDDSVGEKSRELEAQRRVLSEVEKKLREMLEQTPEFSKLRDLVQLELTTEGLRIQLIDELDFSIFDLGSAQMKSEGIQLLRRIAGELKDLPNTLIVEGHTDSRPFVGAREYSNWELSADRANTARRVLESAGVRRRQIREVRGFADRMLKNPDDPYDIHNRRISIMVLFDTTEADELPYVPDAFKYIPLR